MESALTARLMSSPAEGFNAVFSGAMGAAVTRKCDLQVLEDAVFSTLVLGFTSDQTGQAATTTPTYPALMVLENVKSFKLASGSVIVAFAL
jgi:hypothetical protein